MNQYRNLITWILIANFLIILAMGHGLICMGVLQIMVFSEIVDSIGLSYEKEIFQDPLFWVTVINLTGQILLLISLKKQLPQYLVWPGMVLLWIPFLLLCYLAWQDQTLGLTLVTGMPFIVLCMVFIYKSRKINSV